MNPYKKFEKAWQKLERFPTYNAPNTTNREFARLVRDAYEALNEVIEKEQTFRLNSFFKRKKAYFRSIASQSDTALVAHRGWANRVIDTADVVINEKDPMDRARALDSLVYAKDYLERNLMNLSKPQKDSPFDRAYVSARVALNKVGQKIKKLKNARIKPFIKPTEPAPFKSIEEKLNEDLATTMVTLFQDKKEVQGALPLVPEQQGFNGKKTPPPKSDLWPLGDKNEDGKCHWCEDTGTVVDHLHRWGVETGVPCHCEIGQKSLAPKLESLVAEVEADIKEILDEKKQCQPTTTSAPSATPSSDES